jgi:spore germination protein KC
MIIMKKWILLLIIVMFISMPGCWDMREINELGLVMAVGIDKVEGTNDLRVTAQIARPVSQEKGSGASGNEPIFTASAEGKTIFEAIRNLAKFSSRRIMWAHNNVVIIGESMARDDITPVIDFFTRNQELRMRTWVAVSKGDAREYVAAKTGMEDIPGLSISSIFRYGELPAESVRTEMLELYTDFMSGSVEPLISELVLKERIVPSDNSQEHGGQTQVELAGAAVIKRTKMLGWVTPEEARGLGLVRNEIKSAIVAVKLDEDIDKMFSVEIDSINVKRKVIINDNMPSISISVTGNGSIQKRTSWRAACQ